MSTCLMIVHIGHVAIDTIHNMNILALKVYIGHEHISPPCMTVDRCCQEPIPVHSFLTRVTRQIEIRMAHDGTRTRSLHVRMREPRVLLYTPRRKRRSDDLAAQFAYFAPKSTRRRSLALVHSATSSRTSSSARSRRDALGGLGLQLAATSPCLRFLLLGFVGLGVAPARL